MKEFFKLLIKRICGIILLPFLYARYSLLVFIPFIYMYGPNYIIAWFIYALFFLFIMSNCGVMNYWTQLFQWMFKVKYETNKYWSSEMIRSYSIWSYPVLKVRGKEYELSIAVGGSNLYDENVNIRRKAIFYWFLN